MSHHLIPFILDHVAGSALAVTSAGLGNYFGMRAAERLPGESVLPQCLFCQRPTEWHEAFPLFGWLLRPDAKSLPCPCGAKKGLWIHPLTEIIGLLLGLIAVICYDSFWEASLIPLCLGLGLLPAIACIDMAFGIIPDLLNVLLAVFGLTWLFMTDGDVFMSIIGSASLLALGLFLAVTYSRWRGKEMLGLGDVKFFAAAGLWLPIALVPWFLGLAGFLGAAFGFYWKKKHNEKELPFAPALCLSLALCIFYNILSQMD